VVTVKCQGHFVVVSECELRERVVLDRGQEVMIGGGCVYWPRSFCLLLISVKETMATIIAGNCADMLPVHSGREALNVSLHHRCYKYLETVTGWLHCKCNRLRLKLISMIMSVITVKTNTIYYDQFCM